MTRQGLGFAFKFTDSKILHAFMVYSFLGFEIHRVMYSLPQA